MDDSHSLSFSSELAIRPSLESSLIPPHYHETVSSSSPSTVPQGHAPNDVNSSMVTSPEQPMTTNSELLDPTAAGQ